LGHLNLELGICLEFGIWDLGFGILSLPIHLSCVTRHCFVMIDKCPAKKYNITVEEATLKILKYGDEVLKVKARAIIDINQYIVDLSRAMAQTMHQAPGLGLAAPQVGESVQLVTLDLTVGEIPDDLLVLINPQIIEAEGYQISEEGCLSVPGYSLPVKRNARIFFQATLLDGRELRMEFEGLKARVLQHEIDHLNGILIVDRMSSLKRTLIKKEISQKRKSGQW